MSVDKQGSPVKGVPVVEEDSTISSTSVGEMATEEELVAEGSNPKKRKKSNRYAGPDGEAKLKARREANRIHALRSRQRNKQLMHELQQTVVALTRQKTLLEQRNAVLESQVQVLQQQNTMLLTHSKGSGTVGTPPTTTTTTTPGDDNTADEVSPSSSPDDSMKNLSLLLAATAQQNPHFFVADYTQRNQDETNTSPTKAQQEIA